MICHLADTEVTLKRDPFIRSFIRSSTPSIDLKVVGANHDHLTIRLRCQTKLPKGSKALVKTLLSIADAL
jgi:hypothetical protein